MNIKIKTTVAALAGFAALTAGLTACGSDDPAPAKPSHSITAPKDMVWPVAGALTEASNDPDEFARQVMTKFYESRDYWYPSSGYTAVAPLASDERERGVEFVYRNEQRQTKFSTPYNRDDPKNVPLTVRSAYEDHKVAVEVTPDGKVSGKGTEAEPYQATLTVKGTLDGQKEDDANAKREVKAGIAFIRTDAGLRWTVIQAPDL